MSKKHKTDIYSKEELKRKLEDVLDELREADQFFYVWRAFTNAENREIFEPFFDDYPQFSDSVRRSHLTSMIVTLYRLYEKKDNTFNLLHLFKHSSSIGLFDEHTVKITNNLDNSIRTTWKKVCILRNNVFGHKSAKLSPEKAFEKAELTPNELEEMIKQSERLFNHIYQILLGKRHAFNLNPAEDIDNLMKLLNRIKND